MTEGTAGITLLLVFCGMLLSSAGALYARKGGTAPWGLPGTALLGAMAGCLVLHFAAGESRPAAPWLLVLCAACASGMAGGGVAGLLKAATGHTPREGAAAGIMLDVGAFGLMLWTADAVGGWQLPFWARLQGGAEAPGSTGSGLWVCIAAAGLGLLALSLAAMDHTSFGRKVRACGSDPLAAAHRGIAVGAVQAGGMAVAGLLSGVGGFLFMAAGGGALSQTIMGFGFLALVPSLLGRRRRAGMAGGALALGLAVYLMAQPPLFLRQMEQWKGGPYLLRLLPLLVGLGLIWFSGKAEGDKEEPKDREE